MKKKVPMYLRTSIDCGEKPRSYAKLIIAIIIIFILSGGLIWCELAFGQAWYGDQNPYYDSSLTPYTKDKIQRIIDQRIEEEKRLKDQENWTKFYNWKISHFNATQDEINNMYRLLVE